MNLLEIVGWAHAQTYLGALEHRVLVCLAMHVNKKDSSFKVFAGMNTLAEECRCSERQVRRIIRKFELPITVKNKSDPTKDKTYPALLYTEKVFATNFKNPKKLGRQTSNYYYLNVYGVQYFYHDDNQYLADDKTDVMPGHFVRPARTPMSAPINRTITTLTKRKEKNNKKRNSVDNTRVRVFKTSLNLIHKELGSLEKNRDTQKAKRAWTEKQECYYHDLQKKFRTMQEIIKELET